MAICEWTVTRREKQDLARLSRMPVDDLFNVFKAAGLCNSL